MDPAVSSTPQSGQGIRLLLCLHYVAPLLVHRRPAASSEILDLSVPGWHVMALEFATFATIPYIWNMLMSTFSAP